MINVLSWGVGVQSTALLVAAVRGDWGLERPAFAVTADTGLERSETISVRGFYTRWAAERGFECVTLPGNILRMPTVLPLWTQKGGPLCRECTRRVKVAPMRVYLRSRLGYGPSVPPHPPASSVSLWIGFSLDEYDRAWAGSDVAWLRARYPLLERRLTRNACIEYLQHLGLPVPVKSACIVCPFRSAAGWRDVALGPDFANACALDEQLRYLYPSYGPVYVWRGGRPLVSVDWDAERTRPVVAQLPLWLPAKITPLSPPPSSPPPPPPVVLSSVGSP